MPVTNSIAVEENVFSKLQIKETILLLSLSVVFPFLIHLVPELNGVPMGAILLAMFFAPLIAARFFKFHVGLSIAFLSPLINFMITGNPKAILLPVMILQLITFVISLKLLDKIRSARPVSSLFSYIFSVFVSAIFILSIPGILPDSAPKLFLITSLLNALPGIALLVAVDFVIRKLKND